MKCSTVEAWLAYLENQHPKSIDLGLARVEKVRAALDLKPSCPVISVGGTNGKGSVCAMLAKIYEIAGYKVGLYTSPHLLRYHERVQIGGALISDADLMASFEAVEVARGETSLTYFEWGTLAAVWAFEQAQVEVIILEVGLGGRLDAVNVFEPDCTAITSIDLDHQAYLGDTREAIGFEKAGIFRAGVPAICGESQPPNSVMEVAEKVGAPLLRFGQTFGVTRQEHQWQFFSPRGKRHALPFPALRGQYQLNNASVTLAITEALESRLPLSMGDIRRGLLEVDWPGRFQVLPGRPVVVLDVGHNPHAARALSQSLLSMGFYDKTIAVLGMLEDKDVEAVVSALGTRIDEWYLAGLSVPRGLSAEALCSRVHAAAPTGSCSMYETPMAAYRAACQQAGETDRIVVFGSFYTVAEVLQSSRVA